MKLWKEFCQENGGYVRDSHGAIEFYSCESLPPASGIYNEISEPHFATIWNDYVKFRLNFFNNDLKTVLLNVVNDNNNNNNS